MRFTCDRASLTNAANTAARAAASKSPVPALEGLLVEAVDSKVRITGYDLKTGIVCEIAAVVEEQGAAVLPARLFCDIVRRMPNDSIFVSTGKGTKATVSGGNANYEIITSAHEDFPELSQQEGGSVFEIESKNLRAAINETVFAVSDNEARPVYTGELFEIENETLTIVSVDGSRLALRRENIKNDGGENISFIVPGGSLKELERIIVNDGGNVLIYCDDKHITFKSGDTTLVTRKIEGEFLDYKKAIPNTGKYTITAERRELMDAVERVSVIVSNEARSPLRCVFRDGFVEFFAMSAFGQASDRAFVSGDGENTEIGFNNKYMLDVLKSAAAERLTLKITSPTSPCILVPEDESGEFLYMILPVRLAGIE